MSNLIWVMENMIGMAGILLVMGFVASKLDKAICYVWDLVEERLSR